MNELLVERIRQLSNYETGEFMIIPSKTFPNYYEIHIGKHAWTVGSFNEETLFSALIGLSTAIKLEEALTHVVDTNVDKT